MELSDVLHQMMANTIRAYSTADLAIGTVTGTDPLKVKVREDMDALPEEVLWLTEPVIEKKIPILQHLHTTEGLRHSHALPDLSHSHALPDLSHSHSGSDGETGTALEGSHKGEVALAESLQTEDSLEQDAFDSDERLLESEIICYEAGQPLPVEDGYIILNRGLQEGDKVLMLRVCRGQQFIILSRIFKGGAQSAAKI